VDLLGLVNVYDAVQQWTTSTHCPPPRSRSGCIELTSSGGLSTWQYFGIGIGCVAVGACLFVLADRVRPPRAVRPTTG
jgi:hypothetical protein